MIRVEFHCHTSASKDSLTSPADLLQACRRKGVHRVVVTDHNSIEGALRAHALDPQRVIIGEEIMTSRGELLAAFVQERVPAGLEPAKAIARLRDQGAFISVSHPFDVNRSGGWELRDLEAIAPLVDAIETFNARCLEKRFNQQAQAFALRCGLPGTVGSDAHAAFEVGAACLRLPEFDDANGLRQVIGQGVAEVSLSPFWVHFLSTYAKVAKKFGKLTPKRQDAK